MLPPQKKKKIKKENKKERVRENEKIWEKKGLWGGGLSAKEKESGEEFSLFFF